MLSPSLMVACAGLALFLPTAPEDAPSAPDLAAYRAARKEAGRDADAQVQLALWCERHGLTAKRLQHLALALLADPQNATARGLMGLARDLDGHWRKPEQIVHRVQNDERLAAALAEYNRRRSTTADTAEEQWELATWCEQNGLEAEARAHFTAVVRLDPKRDAAWKRLGCKKVGNRWLNEAQIAAAKAEKAVQEKADRHWKPLLTRWKDQLGNEHKRDEAIANLNALTEPRAVPSVIRVFGRGGSADQTRCVQLLGQIDSRDASRALATLAMLGRSDEVRRRATESLRRRDPREFADLLIAQIRKPIHYEVKPVGGPGSPGALFVEGKRFNVQRLYSPPPAPSMQAGDRFLGYDAFGLPIVGRPIGPAYSTGWFRAGDYVRWNTMPISSPTPEQLRAGAARINQLAAGVTSPEAAAGLHALAGQFQSSAQQPTPDLSGLGFYFRLPQLYQQAAAGDGIAAALLTEVQRPNTQPLPLNAGSRVNVQLQRQAVIPIGRMVAEAQTSAAVAQRQLESDVARIDAYNAPIKETNERATSALRAVTGLDIEADREAWMDWYVDQLGYTYQPQRGDSTSKTTVVEQVPLSYTPRPVPIGVANKVLSYQRVSCFGAGTPVHTLTGLRPIEAIQVGDRVLSQDTTTGLLSYEPVLAVHHNPPSQTLVINTEGESVVASTFHRFWKAGQGWAMARDLEGGDTLRTLDGLTSVSGIEPGRTMPVFNLDVAGGRTFFVGESGLLVHDNSLPDLRAEPFDRPAAALAQADTP